MRRPLLLVAALAIVLTAAACTTASPGWTYAPPTPSPTPGPSTDASIPPSQAPASEAPSGEAPSGGAGGSVVQLSALNIQWEQTELSAPAGAPFTIHFNNKDAGIPHDVVIKDAGGMEMFRGQIVTGPVEVDYQIPALVAGTYQFICSIHPNMIGTLTVS